MTELEIMMEDFHQEETSKGKVLHLKVRVKHLCHAFLKGIRDKSLELFIDLKIHNHNKVLRKSDVFTNIYIDYTLSF